MCWDRLIEHDVETPQPAGQPFAEPAIRRPSTTARPPLLDHRITSLPARDDDRARPVLAGEEVPRSAGIAAALAAVN